MAETVRVGAFMYGVLNSPEFYALDVPAAYSDRIHLVDGKLLTWYGPRMASSLTQLSALLRF
jgi:ABC-type hemin transport system substrate-binding protein